MSARIERTLRIVEVGDARRPLRASRDARTHSQRLADALALHREGNALFKGGNPPFAFVWEWRDAGDR